MGEAMTEFASGRGEGAEPVDGAELVEGEMRNGPRGHEPALKPGERADSRPRISPGLNVWP